MSDSKFRPLNENEIRAIQSAVTKSKVTIGHILEAIDSARISYEKMQGGFCVCVIIVQKSLSHPEFGYLILRGASRRSYKDPRNDIRGEMLAFSRALLYSRPVEMT